MTFKSDGQDQGVRPQAEEPSPAVARGVVLERPAVEQGSRPSARGQGAHLLAYVVALVDSAAGSSASLAPSSSTRYALIR